MKFQLGTLSSLLHGVAISRAGDGPPNNGYFFMPRTIATSGGPIKARCRGWILQSNPKNERQRKRGNRNRAELAIIPVDAPRSGQDPHSLDEASPNFKAIILDSPAPDYFHRSQTVIPQQS